MPIVHIHILEGRSKDKKKKLVEAMTKAISESIDTPVENVKIIIHDMKREDYAIGGVLIEDIKKN